MKLKKQYYRKDLKKSETNPPTLETDVSIDEALDTLSRWLVTCLIGQNLNRKILSHRVDVS
ncbi:MAG: hypothetical protein J6D33_01535 [Turicibacter sp.]|nr:hypothetical protein [Turicibacter sp.]